MKRKAAFKEKSMFDLGTNDCAIVLNSNDDICLYMPKGDGKDEEPIPYHVLLAVSLTNCLRDEAFCDELVGKILADMDGFKFEEEVDLDQLRLPAAPK